MNSLQVDRGMGAALIAGAASGPERRDKDELIELITHLAFYAGCRRRESTLNRETGHHGNQTGRITAIDEGQFGMVLRNRPRRPTLSGRRASTRRWRQG